MPAIKEHARFSAASVGSWVLDIVKHTELHKFAVLSRNRRLARNYERYARTVAAFIRVAIIRLMFRQNGCRAPGRRGLRLVQPSADVIVRLVAGTSYI